MGLCIPAVLPEPSLLALKVAILRIRVCIRVPKSHVLANSNSNTVFAIIGAYTPRNVHYRCNIHFTERFPKPLWTIMHSE